MAKAVHSIAQSLSLVNSQKNSSETSLPGGDIDLRLGSHDRWDTLRRFQTKHNQSRRLRRSEMHEGRSKVDAESAGQVANLSYSCYVAGHAIWLGALADLLDQYTSMMTAQERHHVTTVVVTRQPCRRNPEPLTCLIH